MGFLHTHARLDPNTENEKNLQENTFSEQSLRSSVGLGQVNMMKLMVITRQKPVILMGVFLPDTTRKDVRPTVGQMGQIMEINKADWSLGGFIPGSG